MVMDPELDKPIVMEEEGEERSPFTQEEIEEWKKFMAKEQLKEQKMCPVCHVYIGDEECESCKIHESNKKYVKEHGYPPRPNEKVDDSIGKE